MILAKNLGFLKSFTWFQILLCHTFGNNYTITWFVQETEQNDGLDHLSAR